MPQYLRPDADDTDGGWKTEADTTSLFGSVDETAASDSDYIKSSADPDHDICKLRLSDPSSVSMMPSRVRYRYRKTGDAGIPLNLTVSLVQGASTTIASWTHTDISGSFATAEQSLTQAQFDTISDFNDLFIQFDSYSDWWLADSAIDMDFEADLYHEETPDSAHFLMHADLQAGESDGSQVFRDSTGRHSITTTGNAQIDTAQSKFGGASALFDGAGDSLLTDQSSDFNFGSAASASTDFTIDCWIRINTTGTQKVIWTHATLSVNSDWVELSVSTGNVLEMFAVGPGTIITGTTSLTTGVWYHVAVTRSGGASSNLKLFLNGTQEGSTYTTNQNWANSSFIIGGNWAGAGNMFNGWLDELRVLSGTAVWTTTFTPPTKPYAVARGTDAAHFLMHANGGDGTNVFWDETGRHQIAINGNVQNDTAQSKFGGASALFDGSGDYLTLDGSSDFAFGSGDWTIDFWVRFNSVASSCALYDGRNAEPSIAPTIYFDQAVGFIRYYTNGASRILGTTSIATGTWYHIEISRSGTSTKLFVNGTQEGSTYSDSNNYVNAATDGPRIGVFYEGSFPHNGWIEEARVIKGTCAHTTTFTPPTAQYDPELTGPYNYLSCSRASTGYAKTSDGTLVNFAANQLRITSSGLLVEDARTNVMLHSQALDNAAWGTDNLTGVTADATTAPDGTTTADLAIPNTSNTFHRISQTSLTTSASSASWSVYAKAGGYNFFKFTDISGTKTVSFDLSNGTVGTTAGSVTGTIEAMANGWYRCAMVATSANPDAYYLHLGNADNCPSFAGNGTSGVYFWGAQFEQASFPSSYIPTTSSSATRAADVINAVNIQYDVLSAATLSVTADVIYNGTIASFPRIIGDSTPNQALLQSEASNTVVSIYNGSTAQTATLGNSLTFSGGVKVGAAISGAGRSIVGGGGTVGTDATTNQISNPRVGFGGTPFWYLRRLTSWSSRLADATLQGHTAP